MSTPHRPPKQFLSKTALKARKWTDAMIRDLLGNPDSVGSIWVPGAGTQKIFQYALARVETAEASSAFANLLKRSQKRKAAAQCAVTTKEYRLREWVESLRIAVPKLDQHTLAAQALYGTQCLDSNNITEYQARRLVNYMRHEMTDYDELLDATFGMTGTAIAKLEIRWKVLQAIAGAYPELASECERQMRPAPRRFSPY
ncbi:MAG: hypothetical protein IPL39_04125 [Opitutaceae bacterium]|nr:hypothetical protein [Opitutaceae bacterium]